MRSKTFYQALQTQIEIYKTNVSSYIVFNELFCRFNATLIPKIYINCVQKNLWSCHHCTDLLSSRCLNIHVEEDFCNPFNRFSAFISMYAGFDNKIVLLDSWPLFNLNAVTFIILFVHFQLH